MDGKTCLITGGSDGIGYAAALELARLGATVVLAGRNPCQDRGRRGPALSRTPATAQCVTCWPTCRRKSEVRRLAAQIKEELPRLDVLMNNAGAVFLSRRQSVDGVEMTFALNHLGPFLLTTLLLDLMRGSSPARIVNVSSGAHFSARNFRLEDLPMLESSGGYRAYARSKLCNILFHLRAGATPGGFGPDGQRPASQGWSAPTSRETTDFSAGSSTSSSVPAVSMRCQGSENADLPGNLARSRGPHGQVFRGQPRRAVLRPELRRQPGRRPLGAERKTDRGRRTEWRAASRSSGRRSFSLPGQRECDERRVRAAARGNHDELPALTPSGRSSGWRWS